MDDKSSRLPGFYDLSVDDRLATVATWAGLDDPERAALAGNDLTPAQADQMIENVVGLHTLPLGIAANFLVNGRDYLVPMAIEEPSVVAAASYMARLVRQAGGFQASSTEPVMIAQVQELHLGDHHRLGGGGLETAGLAHQAEIGRASCRERV